MQRTQIDFLNHGLLPFVGRGDELRRIAEFWSETANAHGLRAVIVSGEAGIGKSRLMEEAASRIAFDGGAVIYTKLYSDSTAALTPLVARALVRSASAQSLLKSEPEETLASVAAALTRVCGLRPTLLIIEDLHLLGGDALRDFTGLLDRLADEPISLIATSRPLETPARGVLERHLVGEITLAGLNTEEITELCDAVFGERLAADILDVLHEKTTGNTLALRSALRAGLRSGLEHGGRMATVDHAAFVAALERNVRLLSEGMVAHMTAREKEAAGRLSLLGEVFARETAAAVLTDADTLLDALSFKGIITGSPTPPPPVTRIGSAEPPLAFTHSLLHRQFADDAPFDASTMVRMIADNLPFYSLLPFPLLAAHAAEVDVPVDVIETAINKLFGIANALDGSRNWTEAGKVFETGLALLAACNDRLEPSMQRELEAVSLIQRLQLQRRQHGADYAEHLGRLLELTAAPADERWGLLRLRALVFQRRHSKRHSAALCLEQWSQARALVERFPDLEFSNPYVGHLRESIIAANMLSDSRQHREIEGQLRRLMDDERTSPELRRYAWRSISPHLIGIFDDEEELRERFALLAALEEDLGQEDPTIRIWKVALHFHVGYLDRTLAIIEQSTPLYRSLGFNLELLSCRIIGVFARIVIDGDARTPLPEIEALYVGLPEQFKRHVEATAPPHFAVACLLVGDPEAAIHYVAAFSGGDGAFQQIERRIAYNLATGDHEALRPLLDDQAAQAFHPLLALLFGSAASAERAAETLRELAARPILTMDDLFMRRTMLDLVATILDSASAPDIATAAEAPLRRCLTACLDWLAERELPVPMRVLLERHERWLTKAEVRSWRASAAALTRQREERRALSLAAERIQVSMFGTIAVQKQRESEPVRVRGTQLCALLGLMTADCLLGKPLSVQEFGSIVFGNDRDPDSVRKSMNFAVFRLRELLGAEAISTAGDTPALNRDLVEVDIVEAHRRLRDAAHALRDGALMRALPDLIAALRISNGQVPFPTLYDEFFEAAREDFETSLRATTIKLSRALSREGDSAAAEEVLQLAFAAMPDDEEIAELLQEALIALGKRTEAKRVGMRAEIAD